MTKIDTDKIINNVIEKTNESKIENIIKFILSDKNADEFLEKLTNKKLEIILEKYQNNIEYLDKINDNLSELLIDIVKDLEKLIN